jgi:hypothetical protein
VGIPLYYKDPTMINAVKYKTKKAYDAGLKSANILQVHEPDKIIVFDDVTPVKRDMRGISRITEVLDINNIPTGNVLLIANTFNEYGGFSQKILAEAYNLINKHGLKISDDLRLTSGFVVEMPDSMTFNRLNTLLDKQYNGKDIFAVIEEDVIFEAESCDYYAWPYSAQWHLADIEAVEAYNLLDQGDYGSDELTYGEWYTRDVAIIDGHGFEFTHPDLDNNEYPDNHPGRYMTRKNWDCVLNTDNPQPSGINDKHGTVMAGIAASGWADRKFLRGVGLDHINAQCLKIGWNVSLSGTFSTSTSRIVRALNKAALNSNCASIAMPFTYGGYSPFTNAFLKKIRTLGRYGRGMSIFASSGNSALSNFSNVYPASYVDVMAIGASTPTHEKASFSNYGDDLFAVAPGVSIFAIDRCCGRGYNINPDPSYGAVTYFSGTSASAVIAATIAATTVIAYPDITDVEIRHILSSTARRIGPYVYESESNEIGLDLSISPETGNGILTQADAVQAALDLAVQLSEDYVNLEINDFNIRWSTDNQNWNTSQPIPAGAFLRGEIVYTVTNDGPNIFIFNTPVYITMQVTLEEGGPVPTEESVMVLFGGHASAANAVAVGAGETEVVNTYWYAQDNNGTCGLNGNYYLVCKLDPTNQFSETSEEDNFRVEAVQFTTDSPEANLFCDGNNDSGSAWWGYNVALCFYDTGSTLGYQVLGNPDWFVLSETVPFTNNFPVNENIRLNSIIPTKVPNSNIWNININVTNLGSTPIQEFKVYYEFNPGIGTQLGTIQSAIGTTIFYLGRETTPLPSCGNALESINFSYNDQYPGVLDDVYSLPTILNPLQPGESRSFTVTREFESIYFPTMLIGRIDGVNYRPIQNGTQNIHVAQSNVLYFG